MTTGVEDRAAGLSTQGIAPVGACFRCPACGGRLESGVPATCRVCGSEYGSDDGVLVLGASDLAREGYDPSYYERLAAVDRRHFWYRARRRAVLDTLRRRVAHAAERPLLEIGCGAGAMLEAFVAGGMRVLGGCDGHRQGLLLARARCDVPLAQVDPTLPPPLAPGQTLVGLFDVLEHVVDDEGFVRSLAGSLAPDGVLVLTVPAHAWLFDEADRLACHQRRYSRQGLRRVLVAGGLEPVWVSHFGMSLVPLVVLGRGIGRLLGGRRGVADWRARELSIVPALNGLLDLVLRVEWALLHRLEAPWGTSLLAIARRPA